MSSNIEIVTEHTQKGVYVAQFKAKFIAIFAYYVESQGECYLIDPTYDHIAYKDFIAKRGTTLKYVLLTHYHADFIGAHTEFKVPVIMGPGAKRQVNKFQLMELAENAKFKVGNVETRVISTPGHTLESACFILADETGREFCIFTGDTVFLREVGRPDLAVSSSMTAADLAEMLFDSIQKIKGLDKSLRIYPGHGSGSACGKSIGAGNYCDIKTQCEANYAFLINDKKEFVEKVAKDLPAPPKYFFYDAKMNQEGAPIQYDEVFKKVRKALSVEDFQKIVQQGTTIIDTRHTVDDGMIKGVHWLSGKGMICQMISQIIEPETPFALVTDPGSEEEIIERLLRIGYMNILGYNGFSMKDWKGQLIMPGIKKLEELDPQKHKIFIDVRNKPQCEETGVLNGALHVPVYQLKSRMPEVLEFINKHPESDVVVNCKTGVRARLAASILHCHVVQPVTVLNEVFDKLKEKGVDVVPYENK